MVESDWPCVICFLLPPPQLFRRVAAALPGMDATQDKSREDSILLTHTADWWLGIGTSLFSPYGESVSNLNVFKSNVFHSTGFPHT